MKNTHLLSIDISPFFVRYVLLKRTERGYEIAETGSIPLPLPNDGNGTAAVVFDTKKPDSISRIIKAVLDKTLHFSPRLFLTLSQQNPLLIHQAVIPSLSDAELKEAILAEIERLPKFRDKEFDFMFSRQDYSENEYLVVFAAVDKEFQKDVEAEVKKTGLQCRDLEIAPLNLKQVLAACDRRSGRLEHTDLGRTVEALLLIHDEAATLEIYDGSDTRLFYRSSAGIKNLETRTHQEQDHMIALWASEFARVIKSYLSRHQTEKIETVWFVWDKDLAPDLLKKMSEKMSPINLSAPYFTAEQKVFGMKDLNPIYILALTPVVAALHRIPVCFNLQYFFRKSVLKKELVRAGSVFGILSGIVLGLLLVFSGFLEIQKKSLRESIAYKQEEIARLQKKTDEFRKQAAEYEVLYKRLVSQAAYIQEVNRVPWALVFSEFTKEMPDNMSLTSFRFSHNNIANMQGEAHDMSAVAEFMRTIERSSILQDPLFENLNKSAKSAKSDVEEYTFSIRAQLKKTEEH